MSKKPFLIEHFKSCRKTRYRKYGKTYWFDYPYHLYYEDEQSLAYLKMIEKENFSESLHSPVESLVRKYAHSIIGIDTRNVEFFDLGPGLPTKSIPLIKNMQNRKIPFRYIPVDISKSFLKIAEKEVKKYGVKSEGINCLFEELPNIITKKKNESITRIFLIGLTFNNYRPNQILYLLEKLSQENDFALIITEFYSKGKEESILLPYRDKDAENFNFLVLKIMGLKKDNFQYFANFNNNRIEMGFSPTRKIKLDDILLTPNDRIVTAISYRYTKTSLSKYILKYYKHLEIIQNDDIVIYKIKE